MKRYETDGKDRHNLNIERKGNYIYLKYIPNNLNNEDSFKELCEDIGLNYVRGFN